MRVRTGVTGGVLVAMLLCTAVAVSPSDAAEPDAATGLTATVQGSQALLSWVPSGQVLETQGLRVSIVGSPTQHLEGAQPDIEPGATSATFDLDDRELLGGRDYELRIRSIFKDAEYQTHVVDSDPVIVRTPERTSRGTPQTATCSLSVQHHRMTVTLPAARLDDTDGRHTVVARTLEVRRNGHLLFTRSIPGNAAASRTFAVTWQNSGADIGGGLYAVRYRNETPTGPGLYSTPCQRSLFAPVPDPVWVTSSMRDGRITTTWTRTTSPVVPVTSYRIWWSIGHGPMHRRTIPASGVRSVSFSVGSATRADIGVIAVNRYGGTRLRQLGWFKGGTTWRRSY